MSELSTFDKIIAGKVTGSSQESSTSPSTFDKIIGG